MIVQHEAHERRARQKLAYLFLSIDALRSCRLEPQVVEPFEQTLLNHQALERLEVIRSTYDEMVASGALAGIDDPTLKKRISEAYSGAFAAQQFIEYFTADLGRASDIIWRHVAFDVKAEAASQLEGSTAWVSDAYTQSASYDFEYLCNSATFRNAMVEVFDSSKDRLGVGAEFAGELRTLRDLVTERLGN